MARLRRESPISDIPVDDLDFAQSQRRPKPPSPDVSAGQVLVRKSPRKKVQASYQDFERLSEYEYDSLDTTLVPKLAPQSPNRSRQIRLGPLRVSANDLLAKRPSAKNSRRAFSPSSIAPLKDKKATSTPKPTVLANLPVVIEPDLQATDVEIEESVWCGSDGSISASETEDELPSPRKLLGLPRKNQPPQANALRVSSGIVSDLLLGFDTLEIGPVKTYHTEPRLPLKLSSLPSSRPTSSSDKEKDAKAVLRFSPHGLHNPKKQGALDRPVTPPPALPSKSRLMSPSKTSVRIPTPPMRPSLDAFWDVDTVNDWNDQYSPKKVLQSPKKSRVLRTESSQSPSCSPPKCQSPTKRSKANIEAKKDWESRKHKVAQDFLGELDRTVTDGRIAELAASTGGVQFVWSKTLNSTAGRANWRRETTKARKPDGSVETVHRHHASIELAEKVIDDEDRLLNVIAHEFCHLVNFMISGIKDQPHGRQFKAWGLRCTEAFGDRGVEVTTKHSYRIEYKYIWRCSNEDCLSEFKRHSKSIDPKRHACGSCRSRLVQIKPVPRKDAANGAGGYAAYVKQHYASIKRTMPGASQKEVMEAIGRQYRAEKEWLVKASVSGEQGLAGKVEDVDRVARVLEFVTLSGHD